MREKLDKSAGHLLQVMLFQISQDTLIENFLRERRLEIKRRFHGMSL